MPLTGTLLVGFFAPPLAIVLSRRDLRSFMAMLERGMRIAAISQSMRVVHNLPPVVVDSFLSLLVEDGVDISPLSVGSVDVPAADCSGKPTVESFLAGLSQDRPAFSDAVGLLGAGSAMREVSAFLRLKRVSARDLASFERAWREASASSDTAGGGATMCVRPERPLSPLAIRSLALPEVACDRPDAPTLGLDREILAELTLGVNGFDRRQSICEDS